LRTNLGVWELIARKKGAGCLSDAAAALASTRRREGPILADHVKRRQSMRTKRFTLFLLLAMAVVFPLLIGGPVFGSDDEEQGKAGRIEGLWNIVDTLLSGCTNGVPVRTIPDMNLFIHGGQMIETPGTPGVGQPPLQRGTPGLGTWEHVGGRHFTAAFRFFRFNGDDDTFAGIQTANKVIELSKDGNAFTSTGTTDIFDATGALIATRCSTGVATRVE